MAILPLVIAPDPRLKQKSQPVESVDDNIRKLMDDMLETMYHEDGAGLAAVQVGVLKRVMVMDTAGRDEPPNPIFVANPEVIEFSEEKISYNEGCLSFPEQRIDIERPARIKIRYLDYHNQIRELQAEGWLARAVQHEIDHLDGIVFIEYTTPMKRDIMARKAVKIKRRTSSQS